MWEAWDRICEELLSWIMVVAVTALVVGIALAKLGITVALVAKFFTL